MKKRILALLCSAVTVLGNCGAFAEYTDMPDNTNETRIVDIITKTGIMKGYDDGSFKPSQAITRAEFATLLYNAIGFFHTSAAGGSDEMNTDGFDWRSFFLGSDSDDLKLIYPKSEAEDGENEATAGSGAWSDVNDDYWAYMYLLSMKEQGIIAGYGDNTFRPDNTVTCNEAIKIVLTICGYKQYAEKYGGYPEGYRKLASDNKLYSGLTASGDSPMSRMDAATLIYNSFTIKLAPDRYQSGESDKNFLNDIVGIYTVEGTVLKTDVTSIYDEEPSMQMTATIGDVEFSFNDDTTDIRDYIGRDVRAFLRKDDSDDYSLITVEETGRDDITVIDNSLLQGYENNTFTYLADEDSNKDKKLRIKNGSALIFNGKYMEGYSEDTFKELGNGTITVIKKQKLDFDIVIAESFKAGYVESINSKKKQIVDTLATNDAIINLDKTSDNEDVICNIYDSNKKAVTFDDITKGAVNYYTNGNYTKVYMCSKAIKGKISKIYARDNKNYLKIGDTEYKISNSYYKYSGGSVKTDIDTNVVFDMFDEVVWISDDGIPLEGYVYYIKCTESDEDDALIMTYYDIDTNAVVTKNTISSIRVVNQKGESEKVSAAALKELLDGYDGVLKIRVDENDKVKKIEYPKNKDSDDTKALKLVLESNNISSSANYMGNLTYNQGIHSFAGKYYMNANTKLINIPSDKSDYNYYSSSAFSSLARGNYLFKLYSFDTESPYVNLAVIIKSSSTNYFDTLRTAVPLYIVLERTETVNADDEPGVKLAFSGGTELFSPYDTDGISVFDNAMNAFNESAGLSISEGDMVQVAVDSVNGEVVNARVVFDADGVNPAWCGADGTTDIQGCIPGSTGLANDSNYKTNPMGYTGSGISRYPKLPGESDNHQMYMYGFVYSIKEGLMEITSENVAERFYGEPNTTDYSYCYYDPSTTKVQIMHKTKSGYALENGSLDDIRTYQQVGSKCTRAFFNLGGGRMYTIYILNDDT